MAAAGDSKKHDSALQTNHFSLDIPPSDAVWSAWYKETDDTFAEFKSFQPAPVAGSNGVLPSSGGSMRTLSMRQISGQFDDEVAKSWEEDWEDEDVEDTFDNLMGLISKIEATKAAAQQVEKRED